MSDKKWNEPDEDADTPKVRPRTHPDPAAPDSPYDDLNMETPRPRTVTPEDAWEHSTHVQKRTGNMLTQIAHSSGVGMQIADRLEAVERVASATQKKLKRWQAVALAAVSAAGISVVGVAKGLYERGAKEGAAEVILLNLQTQVDRNREEISRLQDRLDELLQDRIRYRRDTLPGNRETTP